MLFVSYETGILKKNYVFLDFPQINNLNVFKDGFI